MSQSGIGAPESGWPAAALDPIGRARVLAATIPSAAYHHGVIDAPYAAVWPRVIDLENFTPRFDSQVDRVVIHHREEHGEITHLRMSATSHGVSLPFRVRIEDGFCLMRGTARLYLVVMAAVPEDGGARTRFLHLEAIPLPGTGLLRRFIQREVDSDFSNLSRLAESGFPEDGA
ncbi:MAG TPA: hypothetical protein VHU85_02545 [Acidimicrobiales bacterium]|jgi:hypothetical protein|nr:hypothetical protein [Acidimicrobiales bacterium]